MLTRILILVLAGLFGSIPVSFLIARFAGRVDLRRVGSGNVGATNVYRALGPSWAFLAFLGDALKGYLPIWVALWIGHGFDSTSAWWVSGAGLLTVLGHLFPPWLSFRGGKGVATSFGVMLALSANATLLALAVWIVLVLAFKVVSVASLAAAVALPVAIYFFEAALPLRLLALVLAGLVIVSHHENLRRLLRGEEQPIRRQAPPSSL